MSDVLVNVENVKKYFPIRGSKKVFNRAVDGVSLQIHRGETLGLVGESGCGKSTLGRTILRLYEPTSGNIEFENESIIKKSKKQMREYRKKMQIIFQDPYASLDPRMTVGDIVGEPLDIQFPKLSKAEREQRIVEQLKSVGLNTDHMNRYPHEFSGGQRQRVSIARSLIVEPEFVVCDEPISALDVSIQAQVINMLIKLQKERNLTYLFIAHDLSVVQYISDRVGVMYLGHIVELTTSEELYADPLHPYTQALLSAIPVADPELSKNSKRILLEGDIPSPTNPPKGCPFSTRCRYVRDVCQTEPELKEVTKGHFCACHKVEQGW